MFIFSTHKLMGLFHGCKIKHQVLSNVITLSLPLQLNFSSEEKPRGEKRRTKKSEAVGKETETLTARGEERRRVGRKEGKKQVWEKKKDKFIDLLYKYLKTDAQKAAREGEKSLHKMRERKETKETAEKAGQRS